MLRRWPTLFAGLACLAAAVAIAETAPKSGTPLHSTLVFVAAVGAVLVGYGIGRGPSD